jgi:hypothetical protein
MGKACGTNGRDKNVYKGLVGKYEGRNHMGDLHADGRKILKFFLIKYYVRHISVTSHYY